MCVDGYEGANCETSKESSASFIAMLKPDPWSKSCHNYPNILYLSFRNSSSVAIVHSNYMHVMVFQ